MDFLPSTVEAEKAYLFVDESYDDAFMGVCVVLIHGERNLDMVRDQLRKLLIDPSQFAYNPGGVLHYADTNISSRQSVARWIATMPLAAYLAVAPSMELRTKEDKDRYAYNDLLPRLLHPLALKLENRFGADSHAQFLFENLTDKSAADEVFFKGVVDRIPLGNLDVETRVVTKSTEPLTFLPDYFLGFVREALVGKGQQTWQHDTLTLLASKIGLVLKTDGKKILDRYERGGDLPAFLAE